MRRVCHETIRFRCQTKRHKIIGSCNIVSILFTRCVLLNCSRSLSLAIPTGHVERITWFFFEKTIGSLHTIPERTCISVKSMFVHTENNLGKQCMLARARLPANSKLARRKTKTATIPRLQLHVILFSCVYTYTRSEIRLPQTRKRTNATEKQDSSHLPKVGWLL